MSRSSLHYSLRFEVQSEIEIVGFTATSCHPLWVEYRPERLVFD
jgi:hypothetical protein